jgi:hypothetical protein
LYMIIKRLGRRPRSWFQIVIAKDPWRESFFRFIAENPGATYHHAVTSDGVNIVYCRDQDKGTWFLPGSGVGPLQIRVDRSWIMKEMIAGAH